MRVSGVCTATPAAGAGPGRGAAATPTTAAGRARARWAAARCAGGVAAPGAHPPSAASGDNTHSCRYSDKQSIYIAVKLDIYC